MNKAIIFTIALLIVGPLNTTSGATIDTSNDVVDRHYLNETTSSLSDNRQTSSLRTTTTMAATARRRELFFFGLFAPLIYRTKVPELYKTIPRPPSHTRAIVIGSGFGGAVTALRLAKAGIATTLLERGQEWPIDRWREIHTPEVTRDGRGLWQRTSARTPLVAGFAPQLPVDKFGGVLDVTEYPNIEIWRGSCVGGGSKVFTGVMIQPKEKYFDQIFNGRVSYSEMNQIWYPKVRQMLRLSPVPQDVYDSPFFAHRRSWDQQASSAGYAIERPDSIFDWNIVRDEINGRSRRSAIIGESNMGNSNGAKFDVTQNYLKEALQTGNLGIFSNQRVTDISKTSTGYSVAIEKLDPSGAVIDRYTITCDYLFLAAGSIGTSELLVKAKAKNTIPNLNEFIGRGWGSNGDSIMTRSFNPIDGANQAAPCTSGIHDENGVLPVTVQAWYVSGTPLDLGIQGSLGMAFDMENRGHFEYINGKVQLVWSPDGNRKAEEAARRVNNIIASRGTPVSKPGLLLLAPDVNTKFTAHPLGGAVLGEATDNYGRVHGASQLYVMDGAVIPGSTGAVNPSFTITALAERNIQEIILKDFNKPLW